MNAADFDPAGARLDRHDRVTRTVGFYSRVEHGLREANEERLREQLAAACDEANEALVTPERRIELHGEIVRLRRLLGFGGAR